MGLRSLRSSCESPNLETLEQQRNLLGAADALEQRAKAIHDWPIDEGTFARVLTIATSVVAITIGRLILGPLGSDAVPSSPPMLRIDVGAGVEELQRARARPRCGSRRLACEPPRLRRQPEQQQRDDPASRPARP